MRGLNDDEICDFIELTKHKVSTIKIVILLVNIVVYLKNYKEFRCEIY